MLNAIIGGRYAVSNAISQKNIISINFDSLVYSAMYGFGLVIRTSFLTIGACFQLGSGYFNADFLSAGISSPLISKAICAMWIGLEIYKFFISPIGWSELSKAESKKQYFSGAMKVISGFAISAFSLFCLVHALNSFSEHSFQDARSAIAQNKEREIVIADSKAALEHFDAVHVNDEKNYAEYVIQGATAARIQKDKDKNDIKRQKLVDELRESRARPIAKVPEIGQANQFYMDLEEKYYPSAKPKASEQIEKNLKEIRSTVNTFVSCVLEFAMFISVSTSGIGALISGAVSIPSPFSDALRRERLNRQKRNIRGGVVGGATGGVVSGNPAKNTTAPITTSSANDRKNIDSIKNNDDVQGGAGGDVENNQKSEHDTTTEGGAHDEVTSNQGGDVSEFIGAQGDDAKEITGAKTYSGEENSTEDNENKYLRMIEFVRDFKAINPEINCGVNRISEGLSISKRTAKKLIDKASAQGLFKQSSNGYEPTALFFEQY